jgi:hypothetical protein
MANTPHDLKPIDTYKRDAARLLKAVRADDATARGRFRHLENVPAGLQLKHALTVIAHEAGFPTWTALKNAAEEVDFSEVFAAPGLKDSINHWFRDYDAAKAHQMANGGVLLPYRHQAFVTSLEILPRLGYEKDDPDWADIGYDFINPDSTEALTRIKARLSRRLTAKF